MMINAITSTPALFATSYRYDCWLVGHDQQCVIGSATSISCCMHKIMNMLLTSRQGTTENSGQANNSESPEQQPI
jgi:hypothetical protein